jgi:hypothetical protein
MPTTKQQMAKFTRETKKMLNRATSPRHMRILANESVKIIVERTQGEGKGVESNGGLKKRLRNVSPDYAEYRESLKTKAKRRKKGQKKRKTPRPRLSSKAATGRNCNLTLTGRMLRTLRTIKVSRKEAVIGWSIEREKEKAQWAVDGERSFLNLSTREVEKVSKILGKTLREEAKKI